MGRCLRWATILGAIALLALLAVPACTAGPGLEPPAKDLGGSAGRNGAGNLGGGATGEPNDFGNPPTGMAGGTTGGAFGGASAQAGGQQADGDTSQMSDAGASDADAGVESPDPDGGTDGSTP